jgi:hypothetical protein
MPLVVQFAEMYAMLEHAMCPVGGFPAECLRTLIGKNA